MKYIITEQQFKTAEQAIREYRLEQTILKFLDDHLTPSDGWDSPKGYQIEMKENDGEIFFMIQDVDDWDMNDKNHMWYSLCDNGNLTEPLPEGHCPVVTLPTPTYDALNGYFGDRWEKLFKSWFLGHTGLNVVMIDRD